MSAMFFQNGVSIGADAGWCGYTGSNNYVVRYSFSTGAAGADSVSLALSGIYYGSGAGSQSFGFKVSSSSVAYANARNISPDSDYGVMSYREDGGYGCMLRAEGLNLAPDSVYYIFVFVATAGSEYYSGWNCLSPLISLSGSYSHPSAAISSITGQVSTGSAVSIILNSPYPFHKARFLWGDELLAESDAFAASLAYICPREWMRVDTAAQSIQLGLSVQGYSDARCTAAAGEPMTGSFILSADSLMRPLIAQTAVSAAAINTGAEDFTQFISGISRARISFDSSGISLENCAGAGIVSYAISCGDSVSESAEPVLESGTISAETYINCIVTDSRGREGSLTLRLEPLPYVAPSLSEIEARRCDGEGLDDAEGSYLRLRARSGYTDIDGKNTVSVSAAVEYGGVRGEEISLEGFESGSWSDKWEKPVLLGGDLTGDSYKLALTISDSLGVSARYTYDIYHQRWAMKFNKKGTALGLGIEPTADYALQLPDSWSIYAGALVLSDRSCGYGEPEDTVEAPVQGQLYFMLTE